MSPLFTGLSVRSDFSARSSPSRSAFRPPWFRSAFLLGRPGSLTRAVPSVYVIISATSAAAAPPAAALLSCPSGLLVTSYPSLCRRGAGADVGSACLASAVIVSASVLLQNSKVGFRVGFRVGRTTSSLSLCPFSHFLITFLGF